MRLGAATMAAWLVGRAALDRDLTVVLAPQVPVRIIDGTKQFAKTWRLLNGKGAIKAWSKRFELGLR